MSGIAGFQTSDGASPAQPVLTALGKALSHRGPDSEARHTSGGTTLVAAALATGDVLAEQPRLLGDGQVMIADGREGEPANAMASLDPATERLTLSRDGFGARPLYYAETRSGFVFGSEPRVLFASGLLTPRLRPEGVRELVEIQFTAGRETLFEGLYRVLPGETLIADRGHVIERTRSAMFDPVVEAGGMEDDLLLQFENLLDVACVTAMREASDPGVIVNDGIESAAILAVLARRGQRGIPVYSCISDGPQAEDTRTRIETMTRTARAEAVIVTLDRPTFFTLLPKVVYRLDDPGSDYGAVALYHLAETAARDTRVLISSEGGRTLFGGYGRYRSILRPFWLGGRSMRARGFLEGLSVLRDDTPSWRDGLRAAENRIAQLPFTRLQAAQALDCALWLPNDLLVALDRCMSAHSVEPRMPFLDPALARFGFALQDRHKINGNLGSYLIRRWLQHAFPVAEPLARPLANPVPALRWIAEEAARLGPLVAGQRGIVELCDPDAVQRLFERYGVLTQKRLGHAAWQLLFFALWHAVHIEGAPVDGDAFDCLAAAQKG